MLLVDILAREGEPLDAYHMRATADVDDNWVCFDPESRVTLKHHISTVRWGRALRGSGLYSLLEDRCRATCVAGMATASMLCGAVVK